MSFVPKEHSIDGFGSRPPEGLWTPDEASPMRIACISVCILAGMCPRGWVHPGGLFVHCLDGPGSHPLLFPPSLSDKAPEGGWGGGTVCLHTPPWPAS